MVTGMSTAKKTSPAKLNQPSQTPRLAYRAGLAPIGTSAIRVTCEPAGVMALGLLFSLSGDIWLMLPSDHFLYGLLSFLLAHFCYIFAILTRTSANRFPWPIIPLLLMGVILLSYLWPTLAQSLKGLVALYIGVIAVMAGLAENQAVAFVSERIQSHERQLEQQET